MNDKDSPCAEVVVTVDLTSCLVKARGLADAQLNAAYQEVRGRLNAADARRLVSAQRLWLQYRDANCAAERYLSEGGTGVACLLGVFGSHDAGAYEGTRGHLRREVEIAVPPNQAAGIARMAGVTNIAIDTVRLARSAERQLCHQPLRMLIKLELAGCSTPCTK